jgi:hypothetical protein
MPPDSSLRLGMEEHTPHVTCSYAGIGFAHVVTMVLIPKHFRIAIAQSIVSACCADSLAVSREEISIN